MTAVRTSETVTFFASSPAPAYVPPPVPAQPSLSMSKCTLCHAVMSFGDEWSHQEWHRVNGLHGHGCAAMVSLGAMQAEVRAGKTPDGRVLACTCGLEPSATPPEDLPF